jgi:hypothetical protein
VFVGELGLFESLRHEEFHVAFLFSLLVESHEVERLFIALDVDFECVESLLGLGGAFFAAECHSVLGEEIRN